MNSAQVFSVRGNFKFNKKWNGKKFLLLLIFGILSFTVEAQIYDPVTWTTSVEKVKEDQYLLKMTAKIERGWHLYSMDVPKGGPIPTNITLEPSAGYMRIGSPKEEEGKEVDDPVFEMKIKYFEGTAVFTQLVKVKSQKSFELKGEVEFMVCDDQRCLPPETVELNFKVPGLNK